ncbi:MAG TPA: sigma-70 family RNA polymerase sigma factor [Steroidobacteraceae bacterium]|nr:sigma-70 family RNA polymerase sigma factor [Steroidobacteraceae bacterium]
MPTDPTLQERDHAWSQLMHAAQSGDRVAYERLLREISPLVRALVRRHCSNRADIEEMVQDTLLTLHRVRHTYDPSRPFCPWLAAIAWRRSIDALRRRMRVARYETPEQGVYETFSQAAANSDIEDLRSSEELGELLQLLPARQREALQALKLKEMTLAEASAASGQSVAALKVNTHRALKALRALVSGRER